MAKQIDLNNKTVVISRTDSIGDVVLTLPMCSWIKSKFPDAKVLFLGRNYTRPIIEAHPAVDEMHAWDEIEALPVQARVEAMKILKADVFIHVFPDKEIAKVVKKAKIPFRIGTSHRAYHLLTCNIRVNFSRKNANEHEAQLNFHLLKSYGIEQLPEMGALQAMYRGFKANTPLPDDIIKLLSTSKQKIVLHPKSQGSAKEWNIDNYVNLAKQLAEKGNVVIFTGTNQEGAAIRGKIPSHDNIHDLTGKMNLEEFISFLNEIDAIVACSTGPLHIAAILGKKAVGLYTEQRPMHPGRWRPIGPMVKVLSEAYDVKTESKKSKEALQFLNIPVNEVLALI